MSIEIVDLSKINILNEERAQITLALGFRSLKPGPEVMSLLKALKSLETSEAAQSALSTVQCAFDNKTGKLEISVPDDGVANALARLAEAQTRTSVKR